MATNFPTALDNYTRPTPGETLAAGPHSAYHDDAYDAVEALEAKVGVNGSAVTTSLDYLIKSTSGGHNHDGSNSRAVSSAAGWTDDGAVVRLTTAADRVVLGQSTSLETSFMFEITKDANLHFAASAFTAASAADTAKLFLLRGRGTNASPATPLSGDTLGGVLFAGQLSTTRGDFTATARIAALATTNISGSTRDTALVFETSIGAAALAERMRIEAGGQLVVGATTRTDTANYQYEFTKDSQNFFAVTTFTAASAGAASALFLHRGRGTNAVPAALASGDRLAGIFFTGQYNATRGTYNYGAEILVVASAAWTGSSATPAYMSFSTNPGAGTVERMRLFSDGWVAMGTTNTPDSRLLLYGTNAAASKALALELGKAAGATNDYVAIDSILHTDASTRIQGPQIRFIVENAGNAIRDGALGFYTSNNEVLTEVMRLTSDGQTVIGASTVTNAAFKAELTADASVALGMTTFAASGNGPMIYLRRGRGTNASPTVTISGDSLGQVDWGGQQTTTRGSFHSAATIEAIASETFSSTNAGAHLIFSTRTGTGAVTERMRITAAGLVQIGGTISSGQGLLSVEKADGAGSIITQWTNTGGANNEYLVLYNFADDWVFDSSKNGTGAIKNLHLVVGNNGAAGGTGPGVHIQATGSVVIGSAALATTATAGFFYIPSMAGAATGVPTAFTGSVAMHYDTTNNRLRVYNGGWKSVALA